MGRQLAALLALTAAVAAGCSSGADPGSRPKAGASDGTGGDHASTTARCLPARRSETGLLELPGEGPDDIEAWALVFGDYPVRQGRRVKIAWRMTGTGPVIVSAIGPTGRRVTPLWGPEPHAGSNWARPGDEWGTGWRFPRPGCWTVHLVRGTDHATTGIRVIG